MKKYFFLILLLLIYTPINFSSAQNLNDEIIGTVNGENLYLSEFNRLFNVQKKKNLDKSEKEIKENLIALMVDELLVLQEGRSRNLQIQEEEISKRINLIKEKLGGEDGFKAFLTENNATIEDARNEIKNQILYEQVKTVLSKDISDFKAYLNEKKSKASIVIYNDKISPEDKKPEQVAQINPTSELPDLRTTQYPTITKSKIEEIKQLEEKTNEILDSQIKQRKDISVEIDNGESEEIKVEEKIEQKPDVIDISKVTEPQVLVPINRGTKHEARGMKKKILTSNTSKALKEKLNKLKLSIAERGKLRIPHFTLHTQNLVPGEPKAQEEKQETVAKIPQQVYENLRPETQNPQAIIPPQPQAPPPSNFPTSSLQLSKINEISKQIQELRQKIEQRRVTVNK